MDRQSLNLLRYLEPDIRKLILDRDMFPSPRNKPYSLSFYFEDDDKRYRLSDHWQSFRVNFDWNQNKLILCDITDLRDVKLIQIFTRRTYHLNSIKSSELRNKYRDRINFYILQEKKAIKQRINNEKLMQEKLSKLVSKFKH